MKHPADTSTPELQLDGQPVFDFDIESGCEWPMPAVRPWKPVARRSFFEWLDDLVMQVLTL